MKTTKIVLSIVAISLMFGGCASHHKNAVKQTYNEETKGILQENKKPLLDELKQTEIVKHTQSIDLSRSSKVSFLLDELGSIEKRVYLLDRNSNDIDVEAVRYGSKILNINTFKELKSYIEATSNYTLDISSNKYITNMPKIVKVENKKTIQLKKQIVSLKGKNVSISDALADIVNATGYSYAEQLNENGTVNNNQNSTNNDYLSTKYISLANTEISVEELLSIISKTLNVYFEFDHDKKILNIEKFKVKYFKLAVNNLEQNGDMSVSQFGTGTTSSTTSSTSTSSTGTGTSTQLQQNMSIKVFNELEDNIKEILTKNSKNDSRYGYVKVDDITGEVVVKATPKSMKQAESMIDNFNNSYGKMIDFELTVYEVLVKREVNYGIDLSLLQRAVNSDLKITALTSYNYQNSFTLDFNGNETGTSTATADTLNEFGTVVNKKTYVFKMHNHLPFQRAKATNVTYTKSIKLVQTGTSAQGTPLYETEREVGEIQDGFIIKARPSIKGDSVSLNLNLSFTSLLDLNEKTSSSGEAYSEPETSGDTYSSELKMRDGEVLVIDSLSVKGKSKDYEGKLPLEDFIIGGKSGNSYVEREMVLVGKMKIHNSNI